MTQLNQLLAALRAWKLWPVAAVLTGGLVAVPVLLTHKSHNVPVARVTSASPPVSTGPIALPISVDATPGHSFLTGAQRDPFAGLTSSSTTSSTTASSAQSATPTAAGSAAAALGKSLSSALSSALGTASAGVGGSTPSTTAPGASSTPSTTTPAATSTPTPTNGLSSTQAYDVSLAFTDASGNLNSFDPLERLSVLPSNDQPLLVELGVLQGGQRVMFAVQPGTAVSGPGDCTPGPLDCEILALAKGQIESVGTESSTGSTAVGLFAVTDITTHQYSSVAAADKARQTEAAAGNELLANSTLDALSLFPYEPSIGVVVDQRTLTVGG